MLWEERSSEGFGGNGATDKRSRPRDPEDALRRAILLTGKVADQAQASTGSTICAERENAGRIQSKTLWPAVQ